MNVEVKRIGDDWSAFDTTNPSQPLATGATFEECLQNLQQWEQDNGLTPGDYQRRIWLPK